MAGTPLLGVIAGPVVVPPVDGLPVLVSEFVLALVFKPPAAVLVVLPVLLVLLVLPKFGIGPLQLGKFRPPTLPLLFEAGGFGGCGDTLIPLGLRPEQEAVTPRAKLRTSSSG